MIHFLVIAMFMVLFVRDMMAAPLLGPVPHWWAAAASLGLLGVAWGAAHVLIWRQGRRLEATRQYRVLRRADQVSGSLRFGAVAIHAFNVLCLGWLDAVRGVVGNIIAVDEVLAVLPPLLVFALSWWSMYPLERRLREAEILRDLDDGVPARPMPGRIAFVVAPLRHYVAMVFVPIVMIVTWSELVEVGAMRLSPPPWVPVFAVQMAGLAVVLTMMPLVMRRVWDTAAIAPGPLRDQILAMCAQHRVRVRELLLWRTHGTMVNGAVMGILWPFRYILLTDALVERLNPRQVEAVTAHEVAHVRARHMPWLMAGAIGSVALSMIALQVLLMLLAGSWLAVETIGIVSTVGALATGLMVFGFASRRFEWQADAFAAQHLSGYFPGRQAVGEPVLVTPEAVGAMSSALETVAQLNHIRREKFTWRHGSIGSRQRRLKALVGQRADRLKADRDAMVVKIFSGAGLVAAVGLIVADLVL